MVRRIQGWDPVLIISQVRTECSRGSVDNIRKLMPSRIVIMIITDHLATNPALPIPQPGNPTSGHAIHEL